MPTRTSSDPRTATGSSREGFREGSALRIAALLAACLLMPVRPLIRALASPAVSLTLCSMKDAVLGSVSILLMPAAGLRAAAPRTVPS